MPQSQPPWQCGLRIRFRFSTLLHEFIGIGNGIPAAAFFASSSEDLKRMRIVFTPGFSSALTSGRQQANMFSVETAFFPLIQTVANVSTISQFK